MEAFTGQKTTVDIKVKIRLLEKKRKDILQETRELFCVCKFLRFFREYGNLANM